MSVCNKTVLISLQLRYLERMYIFMNICEYMYDEPWVGGMLIFHYKEKVTPIVITPFENCYPLVRQKNTLLSGKTYTINVA